MTPAENRVPITRTRPSYTCLPCKRRKIKCDKQRPACRQCIRLDDSCAYEPIPSSHNNEPARVSKRQRVPSPGQTHALSTPPHTILPDLPRPPPFIDNLAVAWQRAASSNVTDIVGRDAPGAVPHDQLLLQINSFGSNAPIPTTPEPGQFPAHEPFGEDLPLDPLLWYSVPCLPDGEHIHGRRSSRNIASSDGVRDSATGVLDCVSPANWGLRTPPEELNLHMGNHFWAASGNRDVDVEFLRRIQLSQNKSALPNENQETRFQRLTQNLPAKKLCDVLWRSFQQHVFPLVPLLDTAAFQAEYDSLWNARARCQPVKGGTAHDSFPCLLWSVLFCGATAAWPALFTSAGIPIRDTDALKSRLRAKADEALAISNYPGVPTLNGLVASVLIHECDQDTNKMTHSPIVASQCMQVARTLGLHREEAIAQRRDPDQDIARRTWYHVIQLEVMAAISSGSTLTYGSDEAAYNTEIPNGAPSNGSSAVSSALVLATGRYEMSRVLRQIIKQSYAGGASRQHEESTSGAIQRLAGKIDGLFGRLETSGIPEQGHIGTQLLSHDTVGYSPLYHDNPKVKTVFNAFGRIMLAMMKQYVHIIRDKLSITISPAGQSTEGRKRTIDVCCELLKHYIHLARLPAFSPYSWFCPGQIEPLQECMIAITYLKQYGHTEDTDFLQYLLGEVFDIFNPHHTSHLDALSLRCRSPQRHHVQWTALHKMYAEVMSSRDSARSSNRQSPAPGPRHAQPCQHDSQETSRNDQLEPMLLTPNSPASTLTKSKLNGVDGYVEPRTMDFSSSRGQRPCHSIGLNDPCPPPPPSPLRLAGTGMLTEHEFSEPYTFDVEHGSLGPPLLSMGDISDGWLDIIDG